MSLLLQALKKAEQRNADATSEEKPQDAVTSQTAVQAPVSPSPALPSIDLQIETEVPASHVVADPRYAQVAQASAMSETANMTSLSLLDPAPEPAAVAVPGVNARSEAHPSVLTSPVQPTLPVPAKTTAQPRTTVPTSSAMTASITPTSTNTTATTSSSAAASTQPRTSPQPAPAAVPSPEAVKFMTYKRELFGQKTSRPVARWLPWSVAAVLAFFLGVYLAVEYYVPTPRVHASVPPTVNASAPTPIPVPSGSTLNPVLAELPVATAAPVTPAPAPAPASTVSAGTESVPKSSPNPEQDKTKSGSTTAGARLADNAATNARVPVPAAPEPTDISIRKDTVKTGMDELNLAYQELSRGNLPVAERRYRDLLTKDRLNPDIWAGLGAVLMRQGQTEEAESMFRRALELNPNDPYARAMVLSLSRSPDAFKDSQLNTLLNSAAAGPGQAMVFALLAAEHAAAKRWNDAQQSYFNALTADPGNPDYAYNLAVTLEHMRQPRLAYDFYRQALEFAKGKRPGFDLSRAQSRLSALKPAE